MLSKRKRLNRDAFNRFFSAGKRFRSASFDLIYTPHDSFHGAVVVSKKVAARAVARNKLRRRAYSLLHELRVGGVWILIMHKASKDTPRATLKDELADIHKKLTQQ